MRVHRGLRKFLTVIVVLMVGVGVAVGAEARVSEEEATLTKVGDVVPAFKVMGIDGKEFSTEALRGKVMLINFFATWCGPCLAELPEVEKEVWQKFKERGLVVLVIGREHDNAEVADFQKKKKFTFAMAGDPKREIYGKFATAYIPRTYIVNREGKISYQSVGHTEDGFKALLSALEKEFSGR